ncbi:MAG: DNA mismatch repair endonuclease MutL [Ruminococcaceae bacterium]|nr:DNA mismatch repair endonuclease MutL [Oscillospiraceae bacterium]
MKINVLPQTIANMIAAGEVVERPASVVKELVENSIDAGADAVTVEVQKGGMTYIRITDNGCGIEPDEVETAFLRHATSKIRTEEDLNAIYTLGFRGEALASIAAVAKIDIFTKTKNNTFGKCVSIEGGEITASDEAGCSDGTTVVVRDLFFNTPARMKFLKSDATETGYITDTVNKMILGHPGVKIKLLVNGRMTVSSPGDGRLLGAIYAVYGKDYQKHMTEVSYEEDGIEVSGYIGTSAVARKDRRGQVFFINERYISSKVISAAVSEAFQNTVMVGKYPVCVLMIKVNGNFVDVNVHPTKIEVRFSDDKKVYNSVFWAVKNALSAKKYVPEAEFKKSDGALEAEAAAKVRADVVKEQNRASQIDINLLRDSFFKTSAPKEAAASDFKTSVPKEVAASDFKTSAPKKEIASDSTIDEAQIPKHIASNAFFSKDDLSTLKSGTRASSDALTKPEPVPQSEKQETIISDAPITPTEETKPEPFVAEDNKKEIIPQTPPLKAGVDFNLVGQVFATYIIVQKNNEMLIIDQHAAQERLFFEQLLEEYSQKVIASQVLLLPVTVTFDAVQFPLVCDNFEFFKTLGFECEEFGENAVVLRAVPAAISDADIQDTFTDIVSLLESGCNNIKKSIAEEALHTMACKRAIKGNSIMTRAEMESLAEKVLMLDSINTCPHGRPICISMTKYELEKQFKRIV